MGRERRIAAALMREKKKFLKIFLAKFSASITLASMEQGGVAEWLKAAVLKTVFVKANVGSNPTSSVNTTIW